MRRLAVIAVVVAVAAYGVARFRSHKPPVRVGCGTAIPDALYSLDTDQASNAATIAAVGLKLGMPNHAVTIALATALLESRLRNLTGGDRDSVGLFQQRPSQGWGRRDEILDPRYAAAAFYRVLVRVPGWQVLDVTVAAQKVQRSAMPTGYAGWEAEARALARALTGEVAGGLVCRLGKASSSAGGGIAVANAFSQDFGSISLSATMTSTRGWAVATWLVAKAESLGVRSVHFNGLAWTGDRGTWVAEGRVDPHVVFAF
ncbi:MAG: hypothetical protein QOG03_2432 [Actinomycetota bacterium]|nr:hypothetical protein [Actinomycetota bacterium]